MIILDTNILVRYFVNDDAKKAKQVESLLKSSEELVLPDVVLVELTFVLLKTYKATKENLTLSIVFLFGRKNIEISSHARKAFHLYTQSSSSLVDCFVMSYGENNVVASFDKKLLRTPGVKSYWR